MKQSESFFHVTLRILVKRHLLYIRFYIHIFSSMRKYVSMFGGILLLDLTWIVTLIFVARKYFLYLFVKKLCAGGCRVESSITEANTIVRIMKLFMTKINRREWCPRTRERAKKSPSESKKIDNQSLSLKLIIMIIIM